jgi:DNA-binding NarL/FixJ family response regulator
VRLAEDIRTEQFHAGLAGTYCLMRLRASTAGVFLFLPFGEMEHTMIRVLVVDDQKLVRKGWCAVLSQAPDIEVVGEARSGKEAAELALKLRPDVILMDDSMPEMDGLEATRQIHLQNDKISIVMVAMTYEEAPVRQALAYGAKGYIAKHEFLNELVPGVRAVRDGSYHFSPSIAKMLPEWRTGHLPETKKTS